MEHRTRGTGQPRWYETLPIGVSAVDTALAGCWLLDLGQGDLGLAQIHAERAAAQEGGGNCDFASGIVSLLRGQLLAARAALERAATRTDDTRVMANAALFYLDMWSSTITPDGCSWRFDETTDEQMAGLERWQRWRSAGGKVACRPEARLVELFLARLAPSVGPGRATAAFLRVHNDPSLIGSATLGSLDDASSIAASLGNAGLTQLLSVVRPVFEAEMLRAAGLPDQARATLRAVRPSLTAIDDPCLSAWAALVEGDALATGPRGTSPLAFGHSLQPSATQTSSLDDRDVLRVLLHDAAGARSCYQDALAMYRSVKARRGMGFAQLRLAYLSGAEGKWDQAAALYADAHRDLESAGDDLGAFAARAGKLRVEMETGTAEALVAREASALADFAVRQGAVAWGLGWGLAFARVGRAALVVDHDVERALEGAVAAQTIFARLDAPMLEAQAHGDRAAALRDADQIAEAIISVWEQLACCERAAGRPKYRTPVYAGITNATLMSLYMLVTIDEDHAGLEAFEKRLVSALEKLPPMQSPQDLLSLLGAASASDEPAYDLLMAIAANQSLPSLQEVRYRLLYTQGLKKRDGDEPDADAVLEQAFTAAAHLEGCHLERSLVRAAQGRYQEARELLRQYVATPPTEHAPNRNPDVMKLVSDNRVQWHLRAATLFSRLESWSDARAHLEAIGSIDDMRQRLCQEPQSADLDLLTTIGRVLVGEGKIDHGLQCYGAAVEILEQRRRLLAREAWRRRFTARPLIARTYREWLDVLAKAKEWGRAFAAADLLSARSIVEMNQGADDDERDFRSNGLFLRYREKAAEVERLAVSLRTAEGRQPNDRTHVESLVTHYRQALLALSELEASLAAASRKWRALALPPAAAMDVEEARRGLDARTLLLAFVPGERSMLGFAVGPQGLLCGWGHPYGERLGSSRLAWFSRLDRLAAAVSRSHGRTDEGDDLAKLFFAPCAEEIDSAEHILIVPIAELNTVPFHAISWRGAPLGLARSVAYLPTAGLLRELRTVPASEARALVIGDPLPPPSLDASAERASSLLPGSRPEAQLVAALYGATPLLRDDVREQVIRTHLAKQPRVIHFACHGRLSRENANASGVVLSDGRMLTLSELAGMRIDADVVVLSACDTAAGVRQGGDLVGVAQALLQAGVRSVVATQWPSTDLCALIVMVTFHTDVRAGAPVASALRRALALVARLTADQVLVWLESHVVETPTRDFLQADAFAMAGGYSRAGALYERAWVAFTALGDADNAKLCELSASKLPNAPDRFDGAKPLFAHPFYWAPFVALGEWRSIFPGGALGPSPPPGADRRPRSQ